MVIVSAESQTQAGSLRHLVAGRVSIDSDLRSAGA